MVDFALTDDQDVALCEFRDWLSKPEEKFMILAGAAGTGKTTLIRYVYSAIQEKASMYEVLLRKKQKRMNTVLCATTNKAAAVLGEITNMEVMTVHGALRLTVRPNFKNGKFTTVKRKDYEEVSNTLFIMDEVSMMDDDMLAWVDRTARKGCKILLIGDHYQLAPIDQPKSVMETLQCRRATLTKVMRHAGAILHVASQFRDAVETGLFTAIPTNHPNIRFMTGDALKDYMQQVFTDPSYTQNTAKILARTNDMVMGYNNHIRKIKGYSKAFTPGETALTNNPIIGTRGRMWQTDSEVRIVGVGPDTKQHGLTGNFIEIDRGWEGFLPHHVSEVKTLLKQLTVEAKGSGNWKTYFMVKSGWLDLRPAYASTVHKSQGSTFDVAFINLTNIGAGFTPGDVARLCYVSTSRAAKEVVYCGKLPPQYGG